MKLFSWFGVTLAACGMVVMLFSERLSGFSVNGVSDWPPGWLNQVHWYLLVGIVLTLGGGLVTQFGPTISRYYVRQHCRAHQRTALVARAG